MTESWCGRRNELVYGMGKPIPYNGVSRQMRQTIMAVQAYIRNNL